MEPVPIPAATALIHPHYHGNTEFTEVLPPSHPYALLYQPRTLKSYAIRRKYRRQYRPRQQKYWDTDKPDSIPMYTTHVTKVTESRRTCMVWLSFTTVINNNILYFIADWSEARGEQCFSRRSQTRSQVVMGECPRHIHYIFSNIALKLLLRLQRRSCVSSGLFVSKHYKVPDCTREIKI